MPVKFVLTWRRYRLWQVKKSKKGVKKAELDAHFGQEITSLCRFSLEVRNWIFLL